MLEVSVQCLRKLNETEPKGTAHYCCHTEEELGLREEESCSDLLCFSLTVPSFLSCEITSHSLLKVFLSVAPNNESKTG